MNKIDFRRIVRDCPANTNTASHNSALGLGTKGLIYDFEVLVDGEIRATFSKNVHNRGYRLYTPDNYPVYAGLKEPGYAHNEYSGCVQAETQADFAALIEGLLLSNRIATTSEIVARIEGGQRALEMFKDAELEVARLRALGEFADEMNTIMRLLADDLNLDWGQRFPGRNHAVMDHYDALRVRIDARIEELQNSTREFGNAHRGIVR